MDAHSRRQAALDAIDAVLNGAKVDDCESEIVDFKEEADTVKPKTRQRAAIDVRHEPAARALAAEAACMANGENGGVLVVGVSDKVSGPDAFAGSYLDTEWLRARIHALTKPSLAVDVIEELTVAGKRIYLINVGPSLEEIWCGGKLRARFEDGCEELTGSRARQFLERRRRFDWSAEPAGLRLSSATPEALELARHHYQDRHGSTPGSDLALARRLGVTIGDSDDPELNNAGALLLCRFEAGVEQLQLLVTRAEGSASQRSERLEAPLLPAFDAAWRLLTETFAAELMTVGAQRRSTRAIPDDAMREAVINALTHRKYDHPRSTVVILATGEPASTLKVTSPGGFPYGVQGDRLLATRSKPRNPALANALRVLGLAEAEGVGISTMFRLMLRDGHPEPEIYEADGEVVCRLPGGRSDTEVRAFFDDLEVRDRQIGEDVRAHIAINDLLSRPVLRAERLAAHAQSSRGEALEVLERLAGLGAVERLLDGSLSFRLTSELRAQLGSRLTYKTRQSLDEHWELVRAYLDSNDTIRSQDAEELLGLQRVAAARVLSRLKERGDLELVGKARGRGVRYRLRR